MISLIKKIIPLRLKQTSAFLLGKSRYAVLDKLKNEKKIIVALGANNGNLDDIAVTYTQIKFLHKHFPDYRIEEIPVATTFSIMKAFKKVCNKNDIITIVGGGNMSDKFKNIEYCRRFIVQQFSENHIISFPQTMEFSTTQTGINELNKSCKIYAEHKKLLFTARVKESYEIMKNNFWNNQIILTPDIVLSLDKSDPPLNRNGIVFYMNQNEKLVKNNDFIKTLIAMVETKYNQVGCYNAKINAGQLPCDYKMKHLNYLFNVFQESQVIITDQLHGMIFAFITRTPRLVLTTKNNKLIYGYEWIKNCKYIKLHNSENLKKITKNINELCVLSKLCMQKQSLEKNYNHFINEKNQYKTENLS